MLRHTRSSVARAPRTNALRLALTCLVFGIAGCSGSDAAAPPPAASRLVFSVQPSGAVAGSAITAAVRVTLQDAAGNIVTTATGNVSIALGTNASGATLQGTTTVSAVSGVATFADLVIEKASSGYTLAANAAGLSGATSTPFDVAPGAKARLAILAQPGTAEREQPVAPAVRVAIADAYGNVVTTATDQVTLALGANPGSATLAGTAQVAATQGIATFSNLSVNRSGSGYTLSATATGLSSATSAAFDVALPFIAIDIGNDSCAVSAGGAIWCWGGVLVRVPLPGVRATAVTGGVFHYCALAETGDVWCWGGNVSGQLGDGTTTDRAVPVKVAGGVTFTALAAGNSHTCALTAAGAAYCWGRNAFGQVGDGTTTNRLTPTPVAGSLSFSRIQVGNFTTCGLTAQGAAWCWGLNAGNIGDGTTTNRLTPVAVQAPPGVTFVALAVGASQTCALTAAGTPWCWGGNFLGSVGDGTVSPKWTPVLAAGNHAFASIASLGSHTCARTSAGAAWCWGVNQFGNLGDGPPATCSSAHALPCRSSPVAVLTPAGVTFTAIAAGFSRSCGLTAAGDAWCWGQQAGPSRQDSAIPVKVIK